MRKVKTISKKVAQVKSNTTTRKKRKPQVAYKDILSDYKDTSDFYVDYRYYKDTMRPLIEYKGLFTLVSKNKDSFPKKATNDSVAAHLLDMCTTGPQDKSALQTMLRYPGLMKKLETKSNVYIRFIRVLARNGVNVLSYYERLSLKNRGALIQSIVFGANKAEGEGYQTIIGTLLKQPWIADPKGLTYSGIARSPLHVMARLEVKELLSLPAKFKKIKDEKGYSILHYLAEDGIFKVSDATLLKTLKNEAGRIPLSGINPQDVESVKRLFKIPGLDILPKGQERAPLHRLALLVDIKPVNLALEIVRQMLRYKGASKCKDIRGDTPLHIIANYCDYTSPKILELLLKSPKVATARDKDGNTPLHIIMKTHYAPYAIFHPKVEVPKNKKGLTPKDIFLDTFTFKDSKRGFGRMGYCC